MRSPALRVHALVTPSHSVMMDRWFLASLPGDCEPVVHARDAAPVEFAQGSWHNVVGLKLDIVLDAIASTHSDDVFVMSDVDICFYGSIADDLTQRIAGHDVLFQNNRPSLPPARDNICTGFMVIRTSSRSRDFFECARSILRASNDAAVGDQNACITVLREKPELVHWSFLPTTYWSPGDPRGRWEPGMTLTPPDGLVLHHANHTVGVANKLAQLEAVAALVRRR